MDLETVAKDEAANSGGSPPHVRRQVPWRWVIPAIAYQLLAITGSLLIDTEVGDQYRLIFRYLTVPVFATCYGVAWMLNRTGAGATARRWWAPGLVAFVLLLTAGGIVDIANALLGDDTPVWVGGTIRSTTWSSGRTGKRYYVVVTDARTGRERKLLISPAEYRSLAAGDRYQRRMRQGGLGYPWRWVRSWR